MVATPDAAVRTPERFAPDDPREWLNRARSQLGLARFNHPEVHPELSCFSAQQAAERAIKAVLIQRDAPFPYVHNLDELLVVAEGAGETPPSQVRQAGHLTRYAEVGRELDLDPPVTAADRTEAVAIAEAVVAWAEERVVALRSSLAPTATSASRRETASVSEPPPLDENGETAALTDADRRTLAEVVRRIVEVAAPERIILFGSAARGETGPDSDFDLLVVKEGEYHHGDLTGLLHKQLADVDVPVDVVVVTPAVLERYRDSIALVMYPALREGRLVYAR